jgi:hypothetical protein
MWPLPAGGIELCGPSASSQVELQRCSQRFGNQLRQAAHAAGRLLAKAVRQRSRLDGPAPSVTLTSEVRARIALGLCGAAISFACDTATVFSITSEFHFEFSHVTLSYAGKGVGTIGRAATSAIGIFRTSLLELMMSVH